MSKGVRVRIPNERQEGVKQRPEDGIYYLDHDQAKDLIYSMAVQMAEDKIEGRGGHPDHDAITSEAQKILYDIRRDVIRGHRR